MQSRYLSQNPYNLVRVVLGERRPDDSDAANVYTRATRFMQEWIANGILAQDSEPGVFPYFQEFVVPDTGERLVRKGFIALGAVEDYSAGVVFRHEQTLSGPKKDRRELLRHTHTHFEPIFMLYADPALAIDTLLDEAAVQAPLGEVTDEYGAIHRIWKIADGRRVQELMAGKKLLIADGHHRYETAIAFRSENPNLKGADRMMMSFVNMHSAGLRILAAHRLVNGLDTAGVPAGGGLVNSEDFAESFLRAASKDFQVQEVKSLDAVKKALGDDAAGRTIIGAAIGSRLFLLEDRTARGELDVRILHDRLLGRALGISEEAVRDEKHLRYVRGIDAAVAEARTGGAQIAFLLKPTSVQQVADTSFSGGVMPQKSTDFYPKLLSGMMIYKLG